MATVFMLIGGMSFFVLFWLLRGNHRRFVQSPELRIYLGIIGVVTLSLLREVDGLSVGDALFTAASASSTTGLAVIDWTGFPSGAMALLLVAVATGAMGAPPQRMPQRARRERGAAVTCRPSGVCVWASGELAQPL